MLGFNPLFAAVMLAVGGPQPAAAFAFTSELPAQVSHSRGTNATMFDSQGRLVWAPANHLLRSDDPTLSWTNSDTTPSLTGASAPSGAPAYLLTEGSVGTALSSQVSSGTVAGQQYTLAAEVKKGSTRFLRIRIGNGSDTVAAWVDFDTGTISAATVTGTSTAAQAPTIAALANGWFLVSVTGNTSTNGSTALFCTAASSGSGTRVANGSYIVGRRSVEPWGVDAPKLPLNITTTAAYYGPRFDYDPVTLTARGLLIEGPRTNSVVRATDTTGWTLTDVTVVKALVGIDKQSNSAWRVTEGSAGTSITSPACAAVTAGSAICASTYLKYDGTLQWVRLLACENTLTDGAQCYFDIQNGVKGAAVARGAGTAINSGMESIGNGWYRCWVSCIPNATYTIPAIVAISAASDNNPARVSNSTYGMDFAQLEVGGFPSSPIPTVGAAATRNSDVVSITGSNFSSWYNQAGGTFVIGSILGVHDSTNSLRYFSVNDNTGADRLALVRASGATPRPQVSTSVSGVSSFSPIVTAAQPIGVAKKVVVQYSSSGKALVLDGGVVATDAALPPLANLTNLYIGGQFGGGGLVHHWGWVRSLAYYNKRDFTNAELQALST